MGEASLSFSLMYHEPDWRRKQREEDPFIVIAHASVTVFQTRAPNGHPGRSHSLWFADAQEEGNFQWFETAFRQHAGLKSTKRPVPFDAEPESTKL